MDSQGLSTRPWGLESIPVSSMLEIIYQLERASCTEYDDNAVCLQILLGKGLLKTRQRQ
jgi:hypothetical protein